MRRQYWLVVCLTVLLGLGACSDDGGDSASNNDPSDAGNIDTDAGTTDAADLPDVTIGALDPESFWEQYMLASRLAACETAFNDCPNSIRRAVSAERTTTVEECVDVMRANMDEFGVSVPEGIGSGRVVFDEAAARECLLNLITKQRADACYEPSSADSALCGAAFKGTVADGENCLGNDECESRSCERAFDPEHPEICWGTCAPALPVVGAGESCGAGVATCDGAQNLVCDTSVCVELGTRQEGESCSPAGTCEDGLYCGKSRTCIVVTGQLGDECVGLPSNMAGRLPKPCAPGLVCAGRDASQHGTCAELGADGDSCAKTYECKIGFYCNADAGACAPVAGKGEPCTDSDSCGRLLYCEGSHGTGQGTCQSPPTEGFSCELPAD